MGRSLPMRRRQYLDTPIKYNLYQEMLSCGALADSFGADLEGVHCKTIRSPRLIEQLGVWNEACAKGALYFSCGSPRFPTCGKPKAVAIICIPMLSGYFSSPSRRI